jgi:phage terminase small subunit
MAAGTRRQHLRFVDEYLIDLNGTQAAIRAGYSPKTANEQASRLLANVNIQLLIAEKQIIRSIRTEITSDRVILEIARLAFSDPRKAFTGANELKDIHDWPDEVAAAISSIKIKELRDADGTVTGTVKEVKFWDKNSAADKLMKHLGAYEVDNRQKSPLQDLSRDTLQLIRDNLLNASK